MVIPPPQRSPRRIRPTEVESTPEQLVERVGNGPLQAAYLIAGPETLRVLEAADAVRAAARDQGISEREVFEFDGRSGEEDWDRLEASFAAPGLFSARRLLELKLPSGKPGKRGTKVLLEYATAPPPDVVLMVTCSEWSKRHEGKWSEALAAAGVKSIAWEVKAHELPGWVSGRLRSRGLKASTGAVQQLVERISGNLLAAAQEIDKLALLAGEGELDADRMQELVADGARFDVFGLAEAALNGEAARVSRVLAGLRAEGEAIPALVPIVARELQTCAALGAAGRANLAAEFKSRGIWRAREAAYRRALDRHAPGHWEAFVSRLGEVDRMAKGRMAGDPWVALERLLLAVAERGAGRLLARANA